METLIAEDVLLLLLNDDTGKFIGSHKNVVIGAALLAELGLLGALTVSGKRTAVTSPRLGVVEGSVITDELLARAFEFVAAHPLDVQKVIAKLGKELQQDVFARLVERGWVTAERGKVLGLLNVDRYPARDGSHELAVRAKVSAVLVEGQDPDDRTAALITMFALTRVTPYLIDRQGLPRKVIKKRVSSIEKGEWASDEVREVIQTAWRMTAPSAGTVVS
jgi:hypothetical protein